MVEMKRTTLLLAVVTILTIFGFSSLQASSPVILDQTAAVSTMFSQLYACFMGRLDYDNELVPVVIHNDGTRVGGDADDYANGKIKPGGTGDQSILPPVINLTTKIVY